MEINHQQTADAIREFHDVCTKLRRTNGKLRSARDSMSMACSAEDWGVEGGRFTAGGRQLNWPLPAVLADNLCEQSRFRDELEASVLVLRELGLDPSVWARVAGELWEPPV